MYPAWRVKIHKLRGVKIGRNVFIGSDVFIDNTYPESIIIEDSVTIISRSFIIGHNFIPLHLTKVLGDLSKPRKGVLLERGCYIGAQCVVMPGVTIGSCSVIGAGSVVTQDVPPYSIARGSPAKVTKTFSEEEVVARALDETERFEFEP
jgi:acetyltransferase-like isoleucine patch superfamily enzyme